MITRAATGGWDGRWWMLRSLDTAQGILQPPSQKSKAGFVLHHHSWHPFKVRDFFVILSRSNSVFSYQSQVVLFCLLMSHSRTPMTRSELLEFLRFYMWPAWLILGLLRSICRAFDTRGFSMIRTLIEIGVKLVPPQKRDGANVLTCTHFLGKTGKIFLWDRRAWRSRNPGYLDLKTTMHSPLFWMKGPGEKFWEGLLPNLSQGWLPWCDSVGPEGWRKQRGLRIWNSRN